MKRISVQGDRFYRGQDPFFSMGFEYAPSTSPGSDPIGGDWSVLCRYDDAVIEREVAGMAECGANTVRVWIAYAEEHWTDGHMFTATARRNLAHFLDNCARHNIYVNVTVGGSGTLWGIRRGLGNMFMTSPARVYTEPAVEEAFLTDVLTVMAEGDLGTRPNILGIDLANEPIFGIPWATCAGVGAAWKAQGSEDFDSSLRLPGVASAWEHWTRERLGEPLPIPLERDFLAPDGRRTLTAQYHAFVHSCFRRHARRLAGTIRDRWPRTLVTIGFGCGGTGANFEGGSPGEALQTLMLTQNIREMQDGLDFVCIHLYDGTDLERVHFLRDFIGSDRPILIQEFGHIPQCVSPMTGEESAGDREAQAALWQAGMTGARCFNYAGFIGSNFVDFDNPEPTRNVWARMGITTRDGQRKLAYDSFRRWALSGEAPADYHPRPLPYDPGAYRHSVQAMGELYAGWRLSAGRTRAMSGTHRTESTP